MRRASAKPNGKPRPKQSGGGSSGSCNTRLTAVVCIGGLLTAANLFLFMGAVGADSTLQPKSVEVAQAPQAEPGPPVAARGAKELATHYLDKLGKVAKQIGAANKLRGPVVPPAVPAAAAPAASRPPLPSSTGPRGMAAFPGGVMWQLPDVQHSADFAFSARILLANPGGPESWPMTSTSLRTVAGTKVSGCSVHGDSQGWALFVHEWGTQNRQLRLSWTSSGSACNELFATDKLVPYGEWVTVGFTLSNEDGRARLFLNGECIADSKETEPGAVGIHGGVQKSVPSLDYVPPEGKKPLYLGSHGEGANAEPHAFIGYMEEVRMLQGKFSPEKFAAFSLAPSASALSHVSASALQLMVRFQPGAVVMNEVDSTKLVFYNLIGGDTPPAGRVKPWALKPPSLLAESAASRIAGPPNMTAEEVVQYEEYAKETLLHAWRHYKERAWGHDEVKPVTGQPRDWMGAGLMILDSMSTLWLMGLRDEFDEAADWVENSLSFHSMGPQSFFETTIRAVGGLAGAHALSGREGLKKKLVDISDRMIKGFVHPNGFPAGQIDLGSGQTRGLGWVSDALLAEVGTIQLEYRYVSHVSGDPKYAQAADKALYSVLDASKGRGLTPIYLSFSNPTRIVPSKISFGAMGDSYYEYLLKLWLQGGKKETRLKDQWILAMDEMHEKLVRKTSGGQLFIAAMQPHGGLDNKMDHLACFVAAMLELGYRTIDPPERKEVWHETAVGLTETCHAMYVMQPSGLSPEYADFNGPTLSVPGDAPHYLLRPEAAEAIYYLWFFTGEVKYQAMARDILNAIRGGCRAPYGYSAVRDVRKSPKFLQFSDSMESFFLAETLKYLYLTFAPRETFDLTTWVFNTEAHPMKMWS